MNENTLIDDCFLHDKDRMRHDDALALLRERLSCIVGIEDVALNQACDRVLAQNVNAPHNVPLHTNAAVDGYAFCHANLRDTPLPVSDRIAAGGSRPKPLGPNTAVRIFTGAPMPEGADTVAMQENCAEDRGLVQIPQGLKYGANCRQAGEDLKVGDTVLSAKKRVKPADIAALASVGMGTVTVRKKLKVALLASGDELREPGVDTLQPGQVYDANSPMLQALGKNLPLEITKVGIVQDSYSATLDAIRGASLAHDVIISTGGASRGAEDHMLACLDELGKRHLWQLAVKPGRPMMFGQIAKSDGSSCLFFGLPGNPVAAMVCFLLYTRPALLALAGARWETPHRFAVPAAFSIAAKKLDRREFQRGILKTNDSGKLTVDKFARDGSGLISSLRESDGLIEISEKTSRVETGDLVSFIPFSAFD